MMPSRSQLLGCLSGALLLASTLVWSNQDLLIGFAKCDITPPVGMRLCGSFRERIATGVHDPLEVRAFVFEQDDIRFVLAGCDLAMLYPPVGEKVRARIASLGYEPNQVLLHASETHNAPDYFGEFREVFHRRAIQEHGHDPAEPIDYEKLLVEKFCEAIEAAHHAREPSDLRWSSTIVPNIAFNRRFLMKNGEIGWNPGKLNPEIVRPAGPNDERLTVLSVHRENPSPVAVLPGFPLHLAILNEPEYSADYPYFLTRALQRDLSPEIFVHFLQAPCCEINHIDVSTDAKQLGYEWAEVVGERLATATVSELEETAASLDTKLSAAHRTVPLSLQQFSDAEIEKQRSLWYSEGRDDLQFLDLVRAGKVTGIYDRHQGGPINVLLQAFQLDEDTALLGLPSEVSVEIGLAIREQSPYSKTIVVQLSNDWFGYIPTRRIFEQGNYEAEVAKIEPGEGEKLIRESIELLSELKLNP